MRYYGNKEQLFALAAEVDLRIPDFEGVPRARTGAALVEHFLERWETDHALQVLLRAASTKAEAGAKLRKVFLTQIAPRIGRLTGSEHDRNIRAGLVATQMIGFGVCRYVLRLPPIARMSRDEAIRFLGPTIQRYIVGKLEG